MTYVLFNFVFATREMGSARDELILALEPLFVGLPLSECRPILEDLERKLRTASVQLGTECVLSTCDGFLRDEVRATSLNSLLVSYLNRFPNELGGVCDTCLSLLTYDSVACGASRGRLTTICVSECVRWEVELGEFYDEWTGCRVWPGAIHISRLLLDGRFDLCNRDVLELGSGIGICGIATTHAGVRSTTFTEYKQSLLDISLSNASKNAPPSFGGSTSGFLLDWSDFDAKSHESFLAYKSRLPEDFVVIGSELVYEEEHGDMVIRVLDQLFQTGASKGLIVIMLRPSRPGVAKFLHSLENLPQSSSFIACIEEESNENDQLAACIYLDKRALTAR